ncbi:MAG: bacteriocin [Lachnospiraceae bacterium]|nr:bacteriocin [Lachnospiraceae bacterium]
MAELNKLTEEELDNISGGMIFNAAGVEGSDPNYPWEVLDNNNCNVLGRFPSRDAAIKYANSFGKNPYNAQEVDWATVQRLRANPNVNC